VKVNMQQQRDVNGLSDTAQAASEEAQALASTASDRGRQIVSVADEQAQQVVGAARDQISEMASEVSVQAGHLLDEAKQHLRGQAEAQTEQVGLAVDRFASQLRALSEGRPDEAGPVAGLAKEAAEQLGQVSGRISEGGLDAIVSDVTRFARRRPAVFLAGAVVAGFAVGRAVKAGRDSNGAAGQLPEATGGTLHDPGFDDWGTPESYPPVAAEGSVAATMAVAEGYEDPMPSGSYPPAVSR
jgi:vacuolar-type H+-ATPase subunit H